MDKVVFIAHALRGDIEGNLESVKKYIRQAIYKEDFPCCPWYAIVESLDDGDEIERSIGIRANFMILERCDELWVCGDYSESEGVRDEIDHAIGHGIPVRYLP